MPYLYCVFNQRSPSSVWIHSSGRHLPKHLPNERFLKIFVNISLLADFLSSLNVTSLCNHFVRDIISKIYFQKVFITGRAWKTCDLVVACVIPVIIVPEEYEVRAQKSLQMKSRVVLTFLRMIKNSNIYIMNISDSKKVKDFFACHARNVAHLLDLTFLWTKCLVFLLSQALKTNLTIFGKTISSSIHLHMLFAPSLQVPC